MKKTILISVAALIAIVAIYFLFIKGAEAQTDVEEPEELSATEIVNKPIVVPPPAPSTGSSIADSTLGSLFINYQILTDDGKWRTISKKTWDELKIALGAQGAGKFRTA